MIQRGKEWIRINTQNNTIECSKDGGRSWHIRFSSECKGIFTDLYNNGSEILACTSKALYSSKTKGIAGIVAAQIVPLENLYN